MTIVILAVTFVLLIKSKIPPVTVFVGALTLTITLRLAPLDQSLKGFSNSGMLTVGVLLMVAAGMYRTGAITLITEKLIGRPKSIISAERFSHRLIEVVVSRRSTAIGRKIRSLISWTLTHRQPGYR
jgi:hypothetical protein